MDLIDEGIHLLQMIGVVTAVAWAMFAILGPVIEVFLDMFLPPEDWDDDDNSPA